MSVDTIYDPTPEIIMSDNDRIDDFDDRVPN